MLKLLLTSSGISNPSIHGALVGLLGKPINECKALFIPTAIYPFPQGAFMAGNAIFGNTKSPLAQLGWKSLGILELTALPGIDKNAWVQTINEADVLLAWGGDPAYLAYWLQQSGLADLLLSQKRDLVYVGVSAGSMAVSSIVGEAYTNTPGADNNNVLTSEEIVLDGLQEQISRTLVIARGAGFIDFAIIPHFENANHPDACGPNAEKWAAKIPATVYAIDDQTAIKVIGDKVEIISEGSWKLFGER